MSPFKGIDDTPKPETVALKAKWQDKLDEMTQSLLPEERETHINHVQGEWTYTIYTDNPRVAWRLLKGGYEPRPDTVEVGLFFDFDLLEGPVKIKTLLMGDAKHP